MATFVATIANFNLNSTWRVVYDALSGKNRYVTGYTPTTDSATKTVSFAGIPDGSTIHSAILTATLGSPSTGAAIRSVNDFYFDGSLEVGAVAGGSKSYIFKFKANGDTATVGNRSSSQSFTNIKITVTYTPPYTAPSVSNVTLAGGTGNLYAGASTGSHALAWTGTNGSYNAISKYLVYRSINGADYALLSDQTATSLNVDAPATAGEYHRYYIVAVGEYSNSAAAYSPYLYAYKAPGAPTGLTLSKTSAYTQESFRISWTASAAGVGVTISKYEVYLGGAKVGETTGLYLDLNAPNTAGTASYTVKAIASNTTYNSASSSAVSLTVNARPAPTVTDVALDASARASGATTTLRWKGTGHTANTITKYQVYRSVNGGSYALLSEPAASATSLSVAASTTAGHNHRYYVIAIGQYSNSSAVYSGYLYTYKAPGAPTGLTFNPASVVQGQKSTLSWTAGAAGVAVNVSKYEVYLGSTLIGSATGTSLQITAPGTVGTHSYTVKAIGSVSGYNSANSTAKSLTTTAAPAPVMGAVSLAASYVAANGSTTLSWSATANATNPIAHYAVYRSIAGAAYANLGNTTGTSMSVMGPGTAGSNHRYYVVAVGTYSNSSAAYSGYLYAYKAPGAPTSVSVSPSTVFTSGAFRVSWNAGAAGVGVGTSKYEVYRDGVLIGSPTTTYLDTTAPAAAGSPKYTVKAIGNVTGYNSALSAAATLTVQSPASTGSLDRSSVPMDGSSTILINIASANAAFTHKAIWKAGSASVTQNVAAGVATTTLTVPLTWCAQFPSATSGTASVVLETYNGATKTGERTYTFTVTVPTSVVPSFTALTASIVPNGIAITNRYVQGYSSVSLAITGPAGAQGSSITKYAITGGGFTAAATQTTTFGKLNTAGTITFTGTITDSRGRTASKTVSITVQPYSAPSLSGVLAYRCNASGTKASNGLYVLLRATNVFSSVDGQNTATLQGRVYMVGATPGAWQGMSSNANLITGAGGILIIKTYYAEIRITDKINNYVYTATIPTDSILFHGLDGVQGAAIGKYAETPKALEIPEDWSFRRGAYVGLDSGNFVGYVAPVGSVFISFTNNAPTSGGTWTSLGTQTLFGQTLYAWRRSA